MQIGDRVVTPSGPGKIVREGAGGWHVLLDNGAQQFFTTNRLTPEQQAMDEELPPVKRVVDKASPRYRPSKGGKKD